MIKQEVAKKVILDVSPIRSPTHGAFPLTSLLKKFDSIGMSILNIHEPASWLIFGTPKTIGYPFYLLLFFELELREQS